MGGVRKLRTSKLPTYKWRQLLGGLQNFTKIRGPYKKVVLSFKGHPHKDPQSMEPEKSQEQKDPSGGPLCLGSQRDVAVSTNFGS